MPDDTARVATRARSGRRSAWSSARARPARARRPPSTRRSPRSTDDAINVMTIEDPVEYVFPSINQIQINEQAGVTFASRAASDPAPGPRRRSSSARSATSRPPASRCRPRSPATSCMSSLHATDASRRAAPVPRHGHRAVPDRVVAARRRRPAARAPQLPALCRGRTRRPSEELAFFERCGGKLDRRGVHPRRGLQLLRRTPATSNASACTRCSRSPTEIRELSSSAAHTGRSATLAAAQGMRTLRDEAIRLVADGEHHHRRGPPDRLRALGAERHECRAIDTSPSTPTAPRSRARSTRRAETPLRHELLRQNLEVQNRRSASARSATSTITPQTRAACRRSCTSRARWPRSCAAASRSSDGARRHRRGRRRTSASGKILLDDQRSSSARACTFSDALAEHTRDLPAVLPRHHPRRPS